jgi:hypothetical protein
MRFGGGGLGPPSSLAFGVAETSLSYGHHGGYVRLPAAEFSGEVVRQQGRKPSHSAFSGDWGRLRMTRWVGLAV